MDNSDVQLHRRPGQPAPISQPAPVASPADFHSWIPLLLSSRPTEIYGQLLTKDYDIDQPLSVLQGRLPTRSPDGHTLHTRLSQLWPVVELAACQLVTVLTKTSSKDLQSLEEGALTILIATYMLVEPYITAGANKDEQPFRRSMDRITSIVANAAYLAASRRAEEVREQQTKSRSSSPKAIVSPKLIQLLLNALQALHPSEPGSEARLKLEGLASRSPLAILGLSRDSEKFGIFEQKQFLAKMGSVAAAAAAAATTATTMTPAGKTILDGLLDEASRRTLTLREVKELSEQMSRLGGELISSSVTATSLAAISAGNPRLGVDLLQRIAEAKMDRIRQSASSPANGKSNAFAPGVSFREYTMAMGSQLPANESRSFEVLTRLHKTTPQGRVYAPLSKTTTIEEGASGSEDCFIVASLWVHIRRDTMPTFLSRCFTEILEADRRRQWESREDEEGAPQRSANHVFPETALELESLVGLIDRLGVFDSLPPTKAGSTPPQRQQQQAKTNLQCQGEEEIVDWLRMELDTAMEALFIEMKAAALDLVRYRVAGELLSRLMAK